MHPPYASEFVARVSNGRVLYVDPREAARRAGLSVTEIDDARRRRPQGGTMAHAGAG